MERIQNPQVVLKDPVNSIVLTLVVFYYFQRAAEIQEKTGLGLDLFSQGKPPLY
jgi:hypothetical protein